MSFLQSERIIEVQDQQEMVGVLGRNDELLRVIKEHYGSMIVARGNVIVFSGEDNEVGQIETLFKELLFLYRQGMPADYPRCTVQYQYDRRGTAGKPAPNVCRYLSSLPTVAVR